MPYILERISSVRIADKRIVLRVYSRKLSFGIWRKSKLIKILFLYALVINLSIPTYLIFRASTIISLHTWNPAYYAQVESVKAFYDEPLIEIAEFYSNNINNSYVTVTFGMHRLTYLLKRPFIDCTWYDQVYLLSSILISKDSAEIVKTLIEKGIRYFLLPQSWHYAYPIYSYYYNNFNLFKMVTQRRIIAVNEKIFSFILLRSFPKAGVDLYELRFLNVTKLKHYFYFERDPILISDDEQSKLYVATIPEISLSDVLIEMKGQNVMKIEIAPYSSLRHEFIYYIFSSPIDLSRADFISFYFYGNSSGHRIALSFWTGDWRNQFEYSFVDCWKGWARLIIPLKQFDILIGSPRWDSIDAISFCFYERIEHETTFYLDRVTADKGITDFYFILLEELKG
jgi:hypothetical protein